MTPSPCIKVCVLDPATALCIGCGRSGHEIEAWPGLGESDRAALVAVLPERLERMVSRAARQGGRRARPTPG
jgi:predicted Fe-S protein YdhL (DUF1289 family)